MYFFYLIYLHPEDSEHKILGMIKITLPDGLVKEFAIGTTPMDIAKSISEGLARNIISASYNGSTIETILDKSFTLLTLVTNPKENPTDNTIKTAVKTDIHSFLVNSGNKFDLT